VSPVVNVGAIVVLMVVGDVLSGIANHSGSVLGSGEKEEVGAVLAPHWLEERVLGTEMVPVVELMMLVASIQLVPSVGRRRQVSDALLVLSLVIYPVGLSVVTTMLAVVLLKVLGERERSMGLVTGEMEMEGEEAGLRELVGAAVASGSGSGGNKRKKVITRRGGNETRGTR
jgi:hypothetical protein